MIKNEPQIIDLRPLKKLFPTSTLFYVSPQQVGKDKWQMEIYVTMLPSIGEFEQEALIKKIHDYFGEDMIAFRIIRTGFKYLIQLGMSNRVPTIVELR
jgi:hypothetical protein